MTMATRANRSITNPYLRALLADEINGIRKHCNKFHIDLDTKYRMLTVAYNCHGRTDQHIRKFGIGVLTGDVAGACPNAWRNV